jgi:peptidoglycan/xylan/chitin deacetylase (PgdA/CDA1 family)
MLILAHHRVTPEPRGDLSVTAGDFRRQLIYLRDRGYRNVPLEQAAEAMVAGRGLFDRAFAVTFDDGYRDNYLHALPILADLNMVATVFIPVNYMDGQDIFPWDHRRAASWGETTDEDRPLSWSQLLEMQQSGVFSVGSHTCSHPLLTGVDDETAERELRVSRQVLEERLGRPVTTFCYPAGDTDDRIIALVPKAGYRFGVVTPPRRLPRTPYTLRRVAVYGHTTPRAFAVKTSTAFQMLLRSGLWPWSRGAGRRRPLPAGERELKTY